MNYGRIAQSHRDAILLDKMRQWQDLAERGINLPHRRQARKNLASLIRKHPDLAKASGFSK